MSTAPALAAGLAALSACGFGTQHFFGGRLSRQAPAPTVALWMNGLGLLAVVPIAMAASDGPPAGRALIAGAVGGTTAGVAVMCIYRAIAVSPVGVVAPLVAVESGAVPFLWGIASGERPPVLHIVGVLVGLAALPLVCGQRTTRRANRLGLALAAAAGLGFGMFYVAVRQGGGGGYWSIVTATLATITICGVVVLVTRAPLRPPSPHLLLPVALLNAAAGADGFAAASMLGLLAVTAPISALSPVVAMLWAWALAGEHLSPVQRIGAGVAVAGTMVASIG
jgi:drug/metabolite transporter (DMT)-like permease